MRSYFGDLCCNDSVSASLSVEASRGRGDGGLVAFASMASRCRVDGVTVPLDPVERRSRRDAVDAAPSTRRHRREDDDKIQGRRNKQ